MNDYCPLCGAHPMEQGEGKAIEPIPEHWLREIKQLLFALPPELVKTLSVPDVALGRVAVPTQEVCELALREKDAKHDNR